MKCFPQNNAALWLCSLLLFVAVVALAADRVNKFEDQIALLEQEQASLKFDIIDKQRENGELKSQLTKREEEINRLQQPQAIQGPAQFPIARVLARSDDTVGKLSNREKTSPEVVFALNSWLQGTHQLIEGQAIWVPVPY
jgi:hypothetical protein|tara:strand:- start:4073 stop:4492 length:420 start_codon:yes stop_codon:yes gene_type:complete